MASVGFFVVSNCHFKNFEFRRVRYCGPICRKLERFSFDRIVGIKPDKWDRHRSSLARASPIFLDRSIQKKTALDHGPQ